jgi:hypothetical protein
METIKFLKFKEALDLIDNNFPSQLSNVFIRYNEIGPSVLEKVKDELRLENNWQPLSGWKMVENGDDDFEERDFYNMIFNSDDLSDDEVLISTLESSSLDRFFLLKSESLLYFMETYSDYIDSPLLFVQPTPYLFIFLRRKVIYAVHDEGYLMKLTL